MRRAALLVLALAAALPAARAWAQEPQSAPTPLREGFTPPADQAPDAAALNPLATLDKQSLTGFRDMPLFTPSRKRPTPPAPVVAEAPPEPEPEPPAEEPPTPEPELKLAGVVEGPEGSVAVVEKDGEIERLRLGDQVDGWLVTGIEGVTLKLTLDDREKEYRMFQRAEGGQPPKAGGDDAGADEKSGAEGETPAQEPVDPSVDQPEGEQPPADQPEGEQPPVDQPEGAEPDDKSGEDPADEAK